MGVETKTKRQCSDDSRILSKRAHDSEKEHGASTSLSTLNKIRGDQGGRIK